MAREEDSGQRPCARIPAEWCNGSRIVTGDNGTIQRLPGLTYRTFCDPCETRIRTCLDELPSAYERLAAEIGEARRGGQVTRSPFGPSEPLHKDIDALLRLMASILGGWAARVRAVARLSQPDPQRDPASTEAVTGAADILKDHVTALLALPAGWMTRTYPLPAGKLGAATGDRTVGTCRHCGRLITRSAVSGRWWAADGGQETARECTHQSREKTEVPPLAPIPADLANFLAGEEIVRVGVDFITVTIRLGAADAGNEIIDLHYRSRKILGETRAPAETFDGVPCRNCEDMALERAEPPSDPKTPAMKSRCASCGDMMDVDEFTEWAARYAKWAGSAGLPACRRCQRGRHDQCAWQACPCRAAGHPAEHAAA